MYDKMKRLCQDRGLTIAKLERMADIGNGLIDDWNRCYPRLGTLDKVARALDMPLVELIDYLGWTFEDQKKRKSRSRRAS